MPRGKGPAQALAPILESDDDDETDAYVAKQKAAQLAKLVGEKRAAGNAAATRARAAKVTRT